MNLLNELNVFSQDMHKYLDENYEKLIFEDVIEIICGAPVSICKKRELLIKHRETATKPEDAECIDELVKFIDEAISELNNLPKPGVVLLTKPCWYDVDSENHIGRSDLSPSLSLDELNERILDYIDYECGERDYFYNQNTWFETVCWHLGLNNDRDIMCRRGKFRYISINNNICFIEPTELRDRNTMGYQRKHFDVLASSSNLNLPVPFKAGDIVRIDCSPFAPEENLLITSVGDNTDCCCLRCAFIDDNGKIQFTSVKHSHCFTDNYTSILSPLYSMELPKKPAPGLDMRLVKLRSLIMEQDPEYRDRFGDNLEYVAHILSI